jgi:hypothetical protein
MDRRWGSWKLDPERRVLEHIDGRGYEIDLEQMTSSAEVLDWYHQIAVKEWVSNEDLGQLVRAIHELLSPQANLCGGGIDKKFNATEYLDKTLRS